MLKRFLIFSTIAIAIIFISYYVVSTYSVKFLQSKIREKLGPGISITQLYATGSYVAVLGLLIKDPHSKLKLFEVDEIRVYPAIRSIFYSRSIVVKKIVLYNPSILILRTRDSVLITPFSIKRAVKPEKREKPPTTKIIIDEITIHNGKFSFIDYKKHFPPGVITLLELTSKVKNIRYPFIKGTRSPVELKGKVTNENDGLIDLNGWIVFKNFDMNLKAAITNAHIRPFEPYYKKSLGDLIKGGFFSMKTGITIRNHILDVSGNVKTFDMNINPESHKKVIISAKTIQKILRKQNNQIKTKFNAKGDLKDPKFNISREIIVSIIGDVSKSSGISLGKQGGRFIKEKAKKGIDAIKKLFRRKDGPK